MGYDFLSVLELGAICTVAFWLVGWFALLVAVRKGRKEFRVKGYMRKPSGIRWFRFLLGKKYDAFHDSGARYFFGISHFCLMGMIIVLGTMVLLLGCALVLGNLPGDS